MERFSGKVAAITGVCGGIPSAIARELLKHSIHVVGLDFNTEKLKLLEKEFSESSQPYKGKFYPLKCDVTNDDDIRKSFDWINKNLKSLSILINGAGIVTANELEIQNIEGKDFDVVFGCNAKGVLLCATQAMKLMVAGSEAGHIINICSIMGHDSYCHQSVCLYVASKHSVRVFSDALRREVTRKRLNIKVTNLSPGLVKTTLLKTIESFELKTDPKEILQPEDIANGCISILSTPENVLKPANEMSTNPETYSGKFRTMQCDVSPKMEIHELFATITKNCGPFVILVNNAMQPMNELRV